MMVNTPLVVAVGLVNVLGGGALAFLVLLSQERAPRLAPISGIAFGCIAIWGQLVIGDELDPTLPELEALVLTAVVSALIDLVGVFSTLQVESTNS